MKDLVIVVPGMLGSRLLLHGKPLWGDDSRTFLSWVRKHGDDLSRLSIGPDDPGLDDLGDGITPDGVFDHFFVVGRFLRAGGYGALLATLQKRLALRAGENLQVFAYDWRRDLRVAARRLATKAEGWLHAWKARSGNPNAKIALVCHAMGGLVGRYYTDVESGWSAVGKLITIGTPFLGSVRALDLLYFGADFQTYGIPLHDVTPVARTFTSVYQLLPQYPSIQTFTGEIVSPFEIRIPTFEHQKMERSKQIHRDLADHHARNRPQEGYGAMRATSIIGIAQPTIDIARLLANGTLSVASDPRETEPDGDGVVSRFSAEAAGPSGFNGHFLYLPQTHGMLTSDPQVLSHLCDLLAERRPGDPPPKTPLPRFTLRRTLKDQQRIDADALALCVPKPFHRVGQRVELHASARSASGHPFDSRSCRISVRVEQIVHLGKRVRPILVRMTADSGHPGWFSGHLKAPAPGTYRATASASHRLLSGFRVSEFFEVDAGK